MSKQSLHNVINATMLCVQDTVWTHGASDRLCLEGQSLNWVLRWPEPRNGDMKQPVKLKEAQEFDMTGAQDGWSQLSKELSESGVILVERMCLEH